MDESHSDNATVPSVVAVEVPPELVTAVDVQPIIDPCFRKKLEELGCTSQQANEFGSQGVSDIRVLTKLDKIATESLLNETEVLRSLNVMTKYKIRALQEYVRNHEQQEDVLFYNDDRYYHALIERFDAHECEKQMRKMSARFLVIDDHPLEDAPISSKMSRIIEDEQQPYRHHHHQQQNDENQQPKGYPNGKSEVGGTKHMDHGDPKDLCLDICYCCCFGWANS